MYNIGDKIFYPMHGAGVIEKIEEKEFLGEKQLYYIMTIPNKNMDVMIPKGKEERLNLRKVVDFNILDDIRTVFTGEEEEQSIHPNHRHRFYMEKIKSGDILEGAKVIRDLTRISRTKNLGTADKNILNNAQEILISELVMVKGMDEEKVTAYLDQVINQ
ncbi:CarD family transcriptional regulator [Salirhabdus euzebyi]|uniref:CarD family transcriptional regulator n=1 Tax=Salirhabdus euzebyi TaxID=394506 RepID=A0A841Q5N5_9BACI|nr:CarD family transcriptional regulator [Salirhabdus euzebyi]MBB6453779.1 CarD family transcriptional regulator [Salirhabdus euzebyi]